MMIRAAADNRCDLVFIRKSTQGQEEAGQIANVRTELTAIGVSVPDEHWFVGTVSRRKVKSNAEFNRLMELVESGKVGTVYIESQDRWGTADRVELFALLGTLRKLNTRLYDLRAKKDLTEKDFATELMAVVNSFKSEKELQDISYRSMRTRVANFKANGSWPTGTHPFGYGKACHAASGQLRWVWQPVSRSKGLLHTQAGGKPVVADGLTKLPRKEKTDRIVLVPSDSKQHVQTIQLLFELYTRVGLSRRQISARLNAEGRTFYDKPFTHSLVGQVLTNPAYVGDTHFGKTRTGFYHTFDEQGQVVAVKMPSKGKRETSARIVQENTHEGLIDRKTWELTQQKLASEQERTSYSPRNPNYYLKQLLVCGHCGKGMTARTEAGQVVYVCASYVAGRCSGQRVECGYHRITHADAERLLMYKIAERHLPLDKASSDAARSNLKNRMAELHYEDEASRQQWMDWLQAGVESLLVYMEQTLELDANELGQLTTAARRFYRYGRTLRGEVNRLPIAIAEFKEAIRDAERAEVEQAQSRVATLTEELAKYTKAWALASGEQVTILKAEADRVQTELEQWRPHLVPLSQRLDKLCAAEDARQEEYRQLCLEWPGLEAREKGEALRRLFTAVTLYWEREFHPASSKPTRPRKTNRPGRYSYRLQTERIEWAFCKSDLAGCW